MITLKTISITFLLYFVCEREKMKKIVSGIYNIYNVNLQENKSTNNIFRKHLHNI